MMASQQGQKPGEQDKSSILSNLESDTGLDPKKTPIQKSNANIYQDKLRSHYTPTPEKNLLQKFDKFTVKEMSLSELLQIYNAHMNKRDKGSTKEARKYLDHLILRINEKEKLEEKYEKLENECNALRTKNNSQTKGLEELEKTRILNSEQEMEITTKQQVINDLMRRIDELEAEIKKWQNSNVKKTALTEAEVQILLLKNENEKQKEHIESLSHELHILQEEKRQKDTEATTLNEIKTLDKEEIQEKYFQLQEKYDLLINKLNEKTTTINDKTNEINTILEMYTVIKNNIQFTNQDNKNQEQLHKLADSESHSSPTYANALKSTVLRHSKSALLLQRRISTKLSMNNIRVIIHRELQASKNMPNVYCTLSRDRNTLIVRSDTDGEVNYISEKIQDNKLIQELVKLSKVKEKRRKIIILGIPKEITTNEILKKISTLLNKDISQDYHKDFSRENQKTFRLVLELEEQAALKLLQQGRVLVGFISCKTAPYAPIIRCDRCQLFGHSKERCRRSAKCGYCMKNHEMESCSQKTLPNSHKCINCFNSIDLNGKQYNFKHSTNSSQCGVFQDFYNFRNRKLNNTYSGSRT